MIQRTMVLSGVLALAATLAAGAWLAGSRIESPAESAARTAPPPPSPILVPVEQRVLSSNVVTRGRARFGLPQPVSIAPSRLKPGPGLVASVPLRNTQVKEGDVLLTASGRPVFVLQGTVPAYRDLGPGISGEDVRQLQQGLRRLGYDPGRVDGVFDRRTSSALGRWYKAKGWEPFGPTREQLANVAALERDWGDAVKSRAAAGAATPALSVEAARAAAEQADRAAAAEVVAREAELRKFQATPESETPLAVEAERAKADYANQAAEADVAAQIAERAIIVLDPRQTDTAQAVANAKLEVARAATSKTRMEGELAVHAAQREATLAAQRVQLAEQARETVRLEGEKNVQAARSARQLAELDARLAGARSARLGADLANARRVLDVQMPVDEVVFLPALPVRVEEVTAAIGAAAAGPVLSVTNNQMSVDSSLPLDTAPLVKPGMPVAIDEQTLGIKARGVVETVAGTPGTRGVDGYHVYFEVRVVEAAMPLEGISVRLTIPIKSSNQAVTAVPISALSLAADGTSRIQVARQGALQPMVVTPGLVADGYVGVAPVQGTLAPGDLVVVGYKSGGEPDTTSPGAGNATGPGTGNTTNPGTGNVASPGAGNVTSPGTGLAPGKPSQSGKRS